MKKAVSYLFLLMALVVTQIPAPALGQQHCSFKTDGTGQSAGLKIKFAVPCDWKEEESKGKVLRTYQYEAEAYGIVEIINIQKPTTPVATGRIDELITAEHNKKITENGETFLWGRKVKVAGQDCAEVAIKLKKKVAFITLYSYIVRYTFYHKNMVVSMTFMLTAETEKDALKYFNENKALLLGLATATELQD